MGKGTKIDPEANDPESRLALVLFTELGGWKNQTKLAKAPGFSRSQLALYFEGKRAGQGKILETVAAAAGSVLAGGRLSSDGQPVGGG